MNFMNYEEDHHSIIASKHGHFEGLKVYAVQSVREEPYFIDFFPPS